MGSTRPWLWRVVVIALIIFSLVLVSLSFWFLWKTVVEQRELTSTSSFDTKNPFLVVPKYTELPMAEAMPVMDQFIVQELRRIRDLSVQPMISDTNPMISDTNPMISDTFSENTPVDVVYTWVDGSDPEFVQRKNQRLEEWKLKRHVTRMESTVGDADRFSAQIGELRYSLESIAAFAPWVRTVFLVTNRQCPVWLPSFLSIFPTMDIRVVDHEEIFPKPTSKYLPTYNSVAIESCLDRIPGLAEHFLYFNDDIILVNSVSKSEFFGNGRIRLLVDYMRAIPPAGQVFPTRPTGVFQVAQINTYQLLQRPGAGRVVIGGSHGPYACRVSFLRRCLDQFEHAVEKTREAPFRNLSMINFINNLYINWCLYEGLVDKIRLSCTRDVSQGALRLVLPHLLGDFVETASVDGKCHKFCEYFEGPQLMKDLSSRNPAEYARLELEAQPHTISINVNNLSDGYSPEACNRMRQFIETILYSRALATISPSVEKGKW